MSSAPHTRPGVLPSREAGRRAGAGRAEIALTGAAGTVGRAVIDELVARGVRPLAIVRSAGSAAALAGTADVVLADVERSGWLEHDLVQTRRLFMLTPLHPRQDELQRRIIDAAKRAGVAHVVKLSALGADPDARVAIHRQHGLGDAHLIGSGMGYTCLRPNAFMQNAVQWRASIARTGAIVLPVGDARVSMIDVRDIAAAAAQVLTTPDLSDQVYELTGPEALSYAEVADHLSRATGRTIRHRDVPPGEARRTLLSAGMPEWAVDARLELYATYRAGAAERTTTTVADLTGRPPRRFVDFAAELGPVLQR